jgi:hypothetical protein
MTLKKLHQEREVLISEVVQVTDKDGDSLRLLLNYDSTDNPTLALMNFELIDRGTNGTFLTGDECLEFSKLFLAVHEAIKIKETTVEKPRKRRTRKR